MIEVTQRNTKGNEQTLGVYTEEEFGAKFNEIDVKESFANTSIETYKENIWLESFDCYVKELTFSKVAYNEKHKLLTVDYLLGLVYTHRARKNREFRKKYFWFRGGKSNYHRGSVYRQMHTFQERKWQHAWDDEEFAPKLRARRAGNYLPDVWDDYWRTNEKNWKSQRKTQWK